MWPVSACWRARSRSQTYLRFIESKLPLIPRYLKRVVAPPFNIGLPIWEYDPEFDLRNHVREVTLKHGTDRELKALAGKIFGKVMDRRHPLWDLTLVHGLKGDHTGLIFRMHHCLADGIAGVGLMSVLMDASPATPRLPRKKAASYHRPVTPRQRWWKGWQGPTPISSIEFSRHGQEH